MAMSDIPVYILMFLLMVSWCWFSQGLQNPEKNLHFLSSLVYCLCYLALHILDHADHSPQSWSINAVSIICNNLPSSPGTKSSLDAEGNFLILDRSFLIIFITCSVRTGVSEIQDKDTFRQQAYFTDSCRFSKQTKSLLPFAKMYWHNYSAFCLYQNKTPKREVLYKIDNPMWLKWNAIWNVIKHQIKF